MDQSKARDIAHKALRSCRLDGATPHLVEYRENHVFRAEHGDDTFAVRLHRRGVRPTAAVRSGLDYLLALPHRGFPVSEPVRATDGEVVCLVTDDAGAEHQVDVHRRVDGASPLGDTGEAFDGTSTLEPDFHRLGQLPADLHDHMQELGRLPGSTRAAWDVDGLVGEKALGGSPRPGRLPGPDRRLLGDALASPQNSAPWIPVQRSTA